MKNLMFLRVRTTSRETIQNNDEQSQLKKDLIKDLYTLWVHSYWIMIFYYFEIDWLIIGSCLHVNDLIGLQSSLVVYFTRFVKGFIFLGDEND